MAKLVNFKDADIGRRAEKQWYFCAYCCQNGGENVKSGWIYGCKGYGKFRCTNLGQLMGVSKYTYTSNANYSVHNSSKIGQIFSRPKNLSIFAIAQWLADTAYCVFLFPALPL